MDLQTAVLIYCWLVAALFLGLWFYYDRRDHARFEQERRHTAFHCTRCGRIYAIQGEFDTAKCPRCGHENDRLRF